MQQSAAIISEAQMRSRNACETNRLNAMKAKVRMTCKTGVGEDGSIDGYCFIFLVGRWRSKVKEWGGSGRVHIVPYQLLII